MYLYIIMYIRYTCSSITQQQYNTGYFDVIAVTKTRNGIFFYIYTSFSLYIAYYTNTIILYVCILRAGACVCVCVCFLAVVFFKSVQVKTGHLFHLPEQPPHHPAAFSCRTVHVYRFPRRDFRRGDRIIVPNTYTYIHTHTYIYIHTYIYL